LVYQINSSFSFIGEPRDLKGFDNPDNDPRGPWRNTNIKSTVKDKSLAFAITNPETKISYTDVWAFSKTELDRLIKEKYLIFPKNKNGQVRKKEFFNEFKNSNIPIKSSWGLFDNQKNTEMLKKILPNVTFLNPKPLELMQYLLKAVAKNNSIILDFIVCFKSFLSLL
jgi:adenine-specific DNA-methyltransferase